MRRPIVFLFPMLLCLIATVAPASAFDLTGHWTGKWSCKGFAAPFDDDGKLINKFTSGNPESTLAITQNGDEFGAVIDLNNGTFRYNGFAMESATNADVGEIFMLGCANANTPPSPATGAEILRAKVKTKEGTSAASFKGFSIFVDDFPEAETCKYTFTRVDTDDPNVDTCP